jgi:hypothetical protein
MSWPWRFVALSEDELAVRRQMLDRYGVYAQLSAVIPVLVYLVYQLGVWVSLDRQQVNPRYEALPSRTGSPSRKGTHISSVGVLEKQWRSLSWWLGGEVNARWGPRGHWIAGISWAAWLLFLSVRQTGDGTSL